MWYVWEKNWFIQGFLCGKLKERGHLENLGVEGELIIECVFKKNTNMFYLR
jgi:hypothetical protein